METSNLENQQIQNIRSSTNNYWSTLLISNSILIAIFSSSSSSLNNKILTFLLVCIALICSYLLIVNFKNMQSLDNLLLGSISNSQVTQNYEKLTQQANEWKNGIKKRVKIVELLLFFEAILIIILILLK